MTRRLAVVMYGQIVGHLERAGGSGPTFTYAREYAATGTVPLSVRMPIAPALYDGRNLQTYLDGLVPESIAVRSRWGSVSVWIRTIPSRCWPTWVGIAPAPFSSAGPRRCRT